MHALNKSAEDYTATPCFGASIRKASRILTRIYDEALGPSGLNLTHFSIAYLLTHHDSATITDLATWMDIDKTAMGRALFPMERDGLISIHKGKDRRSRQVTLTPVGVVQYKKATRLWKKAQKQVEKMVGKSEAATLRSLLQRIEAKS